MDRLRNAALDQSTSEEHIGRNAAIWAHLTKEAPALLAKMIMHGALRAPTTSRSSWRAASGSPTPMHCPT